MDTHPRPSDALALAALATLVGTTKRIDETTISIKDMLTARKAVVPVDEFIPKFEAHQAGNHAGRLNFAQLLAAFVEMFAGRNMAEITADEIDQFLRATYGHCGQSTRQNRLQRTTTMFNYAIQQQERKGLPLFHNPCLLLRGDALYKKPRVKRPVYLKPEIIAAFIESAGDGPKLGAWGQRLMLALPATAGLRANEVLALTPMDVDGRILRLVETKGALLSGDDSDQFAVIPAPVAECLARHIQEMRIERDAPIFPICDKSYSLNVSRHAERMHMSGVLTRQYLRKWCASFWVVQGFAAMKSFVLRHANDHTETDDKLERHYVARLPVETVMAMQDKHMTPALDLCRIFSMGQD